MSVGLGLFVPCGAATRETLAFLTLIAQIDAPGSPFSKMAAGLEGKLLAGVAAGHEEDAVPLHERIRIEPAAPVDSELFAVLDGGRRKNLIVDLEYYNINSDKIWRRKVRLHFLIQHCGLWYALVDEKYHLRVDRIMSARLTTESFETPAGVDPSPYKADVMFDGDPSLEVSLRSV